MVLQNYDFLFDVLQNLIFLYLKESTTGMKRKAIATKGNYKSRKSKRNKFYFSHYIEDIRTKPKRKHDPVADFGLLARDDKSQQERNEKEKR